MTTKADLLRNPYVRIILASNAGKGVNLSPRECIEMSLDDAIATYAQSVCRDAGYILLQDEIVPVPAK